MDLPTEFQSLIDYAETCRGIQNVPAKPSPCFNVIAVGGVGTGKLSVTEAYGKALLEHKFIDKKPSIVDCEAVQSVGQLFARISNEFQNAAGGMIIFENAQILRDDPIALSTLIDLSQEKNCVVALVGDKPGIQKLLQMDASMMLRFPTVMDAENPSPPRKHASLEELTQLPADMKAMKVLQIKKPVV